MVLIRIAEDKYAGIGNETENNLRQIAKEIKDIKSNFSFQDEQRKHKLQSDTPYYRTPFYLSKKQTNNVAKHYECFQNSKASFI